MVAPPPNMMSAYNVKRGPHTPGELEGVTNQGLLLNTGAKASPQIPAYKAAGRRLPMVDAFNTEAAQLQEPELDMRDGYDRVFGNTLYDESSPSPSPTPNTAGPKMNNLFSDRAQPQRTQPQHLQAPQPVQAAQGLAARRNAGAPAGSQQSATAQGMQGEGTMVQAFHDEDAGMPVVSRPHTVTVASTQVQRNVAAYESEIRQLIASGRREEAVRRPAPSGTMVRCYVKRHKPVQNFFGTHGTYQMHLDSGDVFLLAARRRKKSKVSSFVLSLAAEDLTRNTVNCLAKLKANFVGTEYTMWGRTADTRLHGDKQAYCREDLCINFKPTATSFKAGPRAMHVVLPLPDVDGAPGQVGSSESLSAALDAARRRELPPYLERKMAMLATKAPEYDESLKAYTLDFHGRVREASVKNFQLVAWNHNTDCTGGDVILQFGKLADDEYALDFAYPFNAHSALAVALSSIDTKLCYTL